MNYTIDDKVEFLAIVFNYIWLMPTFFIVVIGPFVGIGLIVWSFTKKGKSLTIDYFGLAVSCGMLCLYLLMPIGLKIDSRSEPLDVMRHGYFSVADLYTWIILCVVCFGVAIWTLFRLFHKRKSNVGFSLLVYAAINLVAIFMGWMVANEYGAAWTS